MAEQYLRTQILLPVDLQQEIDRDRRSTNESRSEYLRKAARMRLREEERKRVNLEDLAQRTIGTLDLSKYPEWSSRQKVVRWQRNLRREEVL